MHGAASACKDSVTNDRPSALLQNGRGGSWFCDLSFTFVALPSKVFASAANASHTGAVGRREYPFLGGRDMLTPVRVSDREVSKQT